MRIKSIPFRERRLLATYIYFKESYTYGTKSSPKDRNLAKGQKDHKQPMYMIMTPKEGVLGSFYITEKSGRIDDDMHSALTYRRIPHLVVKI